VSTRPAVRQLGRLSEISQVAAKHGFGYFFDTHRPHGIRSRRAREVDVSADGSNRGLRVRQMLDELGPTFVKFGQLLSTRPDIVPPDIVFELKALQDDVSPVAYSDVERVIQEELELTIEQLFLDFEEIPVAAASIGQVHRATLPNGRRVAVKVQRPTHRADRGDLELMYQAARLVRDRVKALEFIDTVSLVDEFARTIRQELDYRMEARNAEQFHRNFAGHPHVRVPRVFWSYSRSACSRSSCSRACSSGDLDLDTYSIESGQRLST
jgi:ubiquinone biosynthesis protein